MFITKKTQQKLINFVKDRGFEKFHTEENIAKAISSESGELLKNYLWGEGWPVDEENKKDEIADILIFCFYYLQEMSWDADELINLKILKNINKYPKPENKPVI